MSRDRQIDPPAASQYVVREQHGFAMGEGIKQSLPKPLRFASIQAKCLPKHSRLVPSARVFGVQAIIGKLAKIKDRSLAVR
jgi:hypothetical protein